MSILTAADVSTVMGLLASDAPIWVEDAEGHANRVTGVVVRNGQVRLQMAAKPARAWDDETKGFVTGFYTIDGDPPRGGSGVDFPGRPSREDIANPAIEVRLRRNLFRRGPLGKL